MKTDAVRVRKKWRENGESMKTAFLKSTRILAWRQNVFTGKKKIKLAHQKINESFLQCSDKYF